MSFASTNHTTLRAGNRHAMIARWSGDGRWYVHVGIDGRAAGETVGVPWFRGGRSQCEAFKTEAGAVRAAERYLSETACGHVKERS